MSSDGGGGARLLAHVAQSPILCAAHDKARWLALFTADAEINDPVGSEPHRDAAARDRFYETFIAPNHLAFDVAHDVVNGMSVMRDLDIVSVMSTGLRVTVPMHLRYDLVEQSGALGIRRLCAHWELPAMIVQQLRSLNGWRTSMQLTPRLLRHQGLAGLLGFMRGLGGHGRRGKTTAQGFLSSLGAGDAAAASALLTPGAALEAPPGTPADLPGLAARLRGMQWRKLIAAGDYVSATVQAGPQRGVAVCRFDDGPERIAALQVFM